MKFNVDKVKNPEIKKVLQSYFNEIELRIYGVKNESALTAAIADTTIDTIHLNSDITLTGKHTLAKEVSLYGNGYSLDDATLDADQYIAVDVTADGVAIKDVTFNISGNSDGNALYSVMVRGDSRVEDCTFDMENAGSAGAVSVYYEGNANHVLSRNILSNGVAITEGAVMTEVKNNTFAAGKGFGLGACTIGGITYSASDPAKVAAIKAYLIAEGNVTTGEATGLVVEGYFEG